MSRVGGPTMSEDALPTTIRQTLARVDDGWAEFQRRVDAFPAEHLDARLPAGWTRKQMLAHVAAWHDNANERLIAYMKTGDKQPLRDDVDTFNARVARAAEGRTVGEIFDGLQTSFRRLRRQIGYMTDEQLTAVDGWPAQVIAANTYGHYEEHLPDVAAGTR